MSIYFWIFLVLYAPWLALLFWENFPKWGTFILPFMKWCFMSFEKVSYKFACFFLCCTFVDLLTWTQSCNSSGCCKQIHLFSLGSYYTFKPKLLSYLEIISFVSLFYFIIYFLNFYHWKFIDYAFFLNNAEFCPCE